jgi:hypothetical protein
MRALSGTRETGELAMRQVVELEQKGHFKELYSIDQATYLKES